jgi:predicted HAD superfamily Cof-like phosphohydrolase
MITMVSQVANFQREILGNKSPQHPQLADPVDQVFILKCLDEEVCELAQAFEANDLVGAADALADLVYFAIGAGYRMGLPTELIFSMVHKANMTKQRGVTKRGHAVDATKPDTWVDPKTAIAQLFGVL